MAQKKQPKYPSAKSWKAKLLSGVSVYALTMGAVTAPRFLVSSPLEDYLAREGAPAPAAEMFRGKTIRVYHRNSAIAAFDEAKETALGSLRDNLDLSSGDKRPHESFVLPLKRNLESASKTFQNAFNTGMNIYRNFGPEADAKYSFNALASLYKRPGGDCFIHPPAAGKLSDVVREFSSIDVGNIKTKSDPEKLAKLFKRSVFYHEATHCLEAYDLRVVAEQKADLGGLNVIKATEGDSPELQEARELYGEMRLISAIINPRAIDHLTTYALQRGYTNKDLAGQDMQKISDFSTLLSSAWTAAGYAKEKPFAPDTPKVSGYYYISKEMLRKGEFKNETLRQAAQDFTKAVEHLDSIAEKKFLEPNKPVRPLQTSVFAT